MAAHKAFVIEQKWEMYGVEQSEDTVQMLEVQTNRLKTWVGGGGGENRQQLRCACYFRNFKAKLQALIRWYLNSHLT